MDRFVDTDVLIYAASRATEESAKTEKALDLIDDGALAFSTQVFGEFYYQVTRPSRGERLSHVQAVEFLESLADSPIQPMTLGVIRVAFDVKERLQIAYWDAAIIAAAKALGCTEILSEDLNAGQDYDGVRVVNPFV